MNTTPKNPFVPKGTLLDLQGRRRSQFKLAVFCVLAVSVTGLTAMLIQGCKREQPPAETFGTDFGVNTNIAMNVDTNLPVMGTNSLGVNPPVDTNTVPNNVLPPAEPLPLVGGTDYKVAKGDTLEKIAKHHGISTKALISANPQINPKKMKIGDKVVIPVAAPKASSGVFTTENADISSKTYTVKAGDSLGKIAKHHGTTAAAIKAANNLSTDRINVNQKLKIPSKAEAAPVAPAPAPVVEPAPAFSAPPLAPAPVK